jgi:hypothetical protein
VSTFTVGETKLLLVTRLGTESSDILLAEINKGRW